MGRWLILAGMCLIVIGVLITFDVPLTWIGQLPGDISVTWKSTRIFLPITTSLIFGFVLSILLSVFARH
ncbi:MAG: DUF2905 domain-containing protein [Chlamydiota bacterium]